MTDPNGLNRARFLRRAGGLGALATTGGLGTLLSACGGGGESTTGTGATAAAAGTTAAGEPVRGGRILLATVDKPVNMDPADAQLYSSIQVYQNIFSRLIEIQPDYSFRPSLAAKWTQDDEKTWTVDLVDNAVFHNGEPFTADDVKFSFERLPEHPNGVFFSAFKRTEVLGPQKVRFHLSGPFGAFESTLAAFSEIVNKKAVESADPKLKPVGTGPYQMAEWVQDDHITLKRFDKYFRTDRPYLDEAVFRAIGDDSVRMTGLQTGELDWIQRVPAQRAKELASSGEVKATAGKPYLPDVLLLNCSKPPFDDVRVRQALAWAIDREEIAQIVWFGTAVPATEAVSQESPWYTGEDPYKGGPDVEKAKALLKEAGKENLQISFAGQPQVATQVRMGEVLKSQLAKAGIEVRIENFEPAQWFQQIASKTYDMTVTYWSATIDPAHMYYPLAFSGSPWNFAYYKSDRVDAALQKFVFNTDQDARKAAYPEVVRAVAEEAPFIFLVNETQQYFTKPNLMGAEPLPSISIRVEEMWRQS